MRGYLLLKKCRKYDCEETIEKKNQGCVPRLVSFRKECAGTSGSER